jgi:hypothetical protein
VSIEVKIENKVSTTNEQNYLFELKMNRVLMNQGENNIAMLVYWSIASASVKLKEHIW